MRIENSSSLPELNTKLSPARQNSTILRFVRYLATRIVSVAITILIGVFICIVISNHGGMLDQMAQFRIESQISILRYRGSSPEELALKRQEMEKMEGLTLSFFPRHWRYTLKALRLDWGDVNNAKKFGMYVRLSDVDIRTQSIRTIILSRLPNTLILSGAAYFLVALLAISLALFTSQREGKWLDRILSILLPVSSVPSWVIGVLLVFVFAVQIKIFPAGTMTGLRPPATASEYVLAVLNHLVLPVLAIVLSLVFQLAANWRTFLMIFSEDDFVTMAKAKGLPRRIIERRYLLRPVMPYMLTSFVVTLVGFWQTITALEFFFQWPGIGKLYVDALPNFHGESMFAGELGIVIGIVVLFAYLLGITVICLDFLYLLLDPRIRLNTQSSLSELRIRRSKDNIHSRGSFKKQKSRQYTFLSVNNNLSEPTPSLREKSKVWWIAMRTKSSQTFKLIVQDPASLTGFILVSLLILISLFVIIFLPYRSIGKEWVTLQHEVVPLRAKLAQPVWTNWFRKDDLPPTMLLESNNPDGTDNANGSIVEKVVTKDTYGNTRVEIDFDFQFPYTYFPSEVSLLLTPEFNEKPPFVSLTWVGASGREISLQNIRVDKPTYYDFDTGISIRKTMIQMPKIKEWFVTSGNYPTPSFQILFADPQANEAQALEGEYHLRIESTHFEPQGNMDASLVLYGQVEGLAGTDFQRRDLLVPLLWGLPFALLIGLVGSLTTTILSMTIAAISAWYGGWIDSFIQRLTEANLILPVMAIGVLLYAYYGFNLWLIIGLIVLLNVLGSPTKAFRAAFLQVREDSYIEAARAYGASDWQIITRYLIPRILPAIIPQIITLIPNFFFLEATLAIFNISDTRFPTWGRVIYSALRYGASYGSPFWVLEPIALMLITGIAFVLLGHAVNRILNPQLRLT